MHSHAAFLAILSREYYLDGASKVDLAKRHDISRFQVARYLDEARRTGIVRIEILDPSGGDRPDAKVLAGFLGLEEVVIAPVGHSPGGDREVLADQVGAHIRAHVRPGARLGVAWSRTLARAIAGIGTLPRTEIVQLVGAVPLRSGTPEAAVTDGAEFIARLVGLAPGHTSIVWAPLVVENATTADSLRRQPEIAQALRRADHLDQAYVALGAWQPQSSTVYEVVEPSDRAALAAEGAVVEFCGRLLTAAGVPVHGLDERVIGVGLDQLRRVDSVVGIALGPELEQAVLGAAASGIFTSMILGHQLAAALMSMERERAAGAAAQPAHDATAPLAAGAQEDE